MSKPSTTRPTFLASALTRTINQLKKKKKNRAGVLALVAPIQPDWWGGDPDFAGLVPRDDQEEDMEILILQWPESAQAGETDILTFQVKPSDSSTWQNAQPPIPLAGPLDPDDFPMALMLNKSNFAREGTFDLRYTVLGDTGTTAISDSTAFIIDKTPPNDNQRPDAPIFVDQVVIDEGISGDYLASNGGVVITIPDYLGAGLGDSLEIYVHNPSTTPTDATYVGEMDSNRQIKIPAAAFDGLLDGTIYVAYRLVDKVGNVGPESQNITTGLFINPLPTLPLAAPKVPRIANDKILNLNDIAQDRGANLVEIDLFPNWLERDELTLKWGTAPTQVTHTISTEQDPIVLNVLYTSILKPAYGTATGVVSTPVSYIVKRGNKEFASETATIDVDFFVPGPVNPDRPGPINSALPKVVVRGTGSTPTDNVLNEDDANLPVEVTFDLYDPIGPREQIILYWYSIDNPVATLDPVVGTSGDSFTFTLLWEDIEDLPSGTDVPVFYTVGRADGSGNVESCVPTLVNVSAALPIELATPEFPDAGEAANLEPILNCSSFMGADQHVVVFIPPNIPLLQGGEELEFTWSCFTDKLGQTPAGTPQVFTRTLTLAEATNGFELQLQPFDDYILPVDRNGSITLTYVSDTAPPMQGTVHIRAAATDAAGVCAPNTRRAYRTGGGCC